MIYDRPHRLGMRLRQHIQLRKLSRNELWNRRQLIRTIEPITQAAYHQVEQEVWKNDEGNAPHGDPWHVSFHASQFPGDNPMACPRAALYQMMGVANEGAFSRRSRTVMNVGKAIEVDLVNTWHRAGILLSAPPSADVQTGFEVPDAWLTGTTDAVIDLRDMPVPVEIKTKYHDVIMDMRNGKVGPDEGHISQVKVEIALVRLFQGELWPGRPAVSHGYIFYLSRDAPFETAEFRVDYDQHFFEAGIAQLKQWKGWFEEGFLPSINPSKKHPMGWRWSYPPCNYCPFKKACQLDHRENRHDLLDSIAIDRTQVVRPDYDPEAAREAVLERWRDTKTGSPITAPALRGKIPPRDSDSDPEPKRARKRPARSS